MSRCDLYWCCCPQAQTPSRWGTTHLEEHVARLKGVYVSPRPRQTLGKAIDNELLQLRQDRHRGIMATQRFDAAGAAHIVLCEVAAVLAEDAQRAVWQPDAPLHSERFQARHSPRKRCSVVDIHRASVSPDTKVEDAQTRQAPQREKV